MVVQKDAKQHISLPAVSQSLPADEAFVSFGEIASVQISNSNPGGTVCVARQPPPAPAECRKWSRKRSTLI